MKKIILFIIVILIVTTGFVFATNINGTFANFPIANVNINGEALVSDVPGVILQGRTLLPARAIAEALNAFVSWDQSTMTAKIYKPDVNMIFIDEQIEERDGTWTLKNVGIGEDSIGTGKWAHIFFTTGPMDKQSYKFRIMLESPDGEILATSDILEAVVDTGIMGQFFLDNLSYQKPGNYTFNFQMEINNNFVTIENSILVVK